MILLQNYIRTVKIFPSADNFTQALLVIIIMLVTNITSELTMCFSKTCPLWVLLSYIIWSQSHIRPFLLYGHFLFGTAWSKLSSSILPSDHQCYILTMYFISAVNDTHQEPQLPWWQHMMAIKMRHNNQLL